MYSLEGDQPLAFVLKKHDYIYIYMIYKHIYIYLYTLVCVCLSSFSLDMVHTNSTWCLQLNCIVVKISTHRPRIWSSSEFLTSTTSLLYYQLIRALCSGDQYRKWHCAFRILSRTRQEFNQSIKLLFQSLCYAYVIFSIQKTYTFFKIYKIVVVYNIFIHL